MMLEQAQRRNLQEKGRWQEERVQLGVKK